MPIAKVLVPVSNLAGQGGGSQFTLNNKEKENTKMGEKGEMVKIEEPAADTFAAKKTSAQRMMDIALLTSNANQLRYVLRAGKDRPNFRACLALICISLFLQIMVGLVMIFFKSKSGASERREGIINNVEVSGVFMVTIVNVLIVAFAIDEE